MINKFRSLWPVSVVIWPTIIKHFEWPESIDGKWYHVQFGNCWLRLLLFCPYSAHLKAVEKDFLWILTFEPMFAFTLVTAHMSALLTPVIKGLRSQQTSSHTSWHMQKEENRINRSRTLTICVQIFRNETFLDLFTKQSLWFCKTARTS